MKSHELASGSSLLARRLKRRQTKESLMLQFEVKLVTRDGRHYSVSIGALSAPDAADIAQRMFPGSRIILTRQL